MFYTYADKQGDGFFGSWQLRQVAFDTMRRYLYYSEPTKEAFPIAPGATYDTSEAATATTGAATASSAVAGAGADEVGSVTTTTASSVQPLSTVERDGATSVTKATCSPAKLVWRKKIKVTAVVPVATKASFVHRTTNERDLYQLEIKGESRPLATGEYPPAGPLLCPSAGLSTLERARCNASNEAYICDPFFLKELFDALRDQFDEMAKARVRAAAAAAEGAAGSEAASAEPVDFGVQTLVSPRRPKTDVGGYEAAAVVPVRVVLRCRDEREFRRLWYVLQTVLGYDKLIVRPYRGLPPYDPRNGVAFAHIPMAVWQTFKALDKAVFYTFMRGNFYALESTDCGATAAAALFSSSGSLSPLTTVPRLRLVLDSAYLCITHDSVLCMRESGNIPRWLRLAEMQEFHWDVVSREGRTNKAAPFCAFLSDAPIPDLFFEPMAPAYGADAIAAYDPLVGVRRIARVIHDSCFASFSTRRVIRIKEVCDLSLEAYVVRTVQEGIRLPAVQVGDDYNSTLSCPLPKEQLAVVWQQVQSELLERGNMANRAAIPIYRTNAHDIELSEDQLSTVERELEEERERRDDVVGMPLERARQLERRRRAAVESANARHNRPLHRDAHSASGVGAVSRRSDANASSSRGGGAVTTTTTTTRVMPLTMEMLQTPQLQGRFATTVAQLQQEGGTRSGVGSKSERSSPSSPSVSTAAASEYLSYRVPGARYLTQEEWQRRGGASPASPLATAPDAANIATEATSTVTPVATTSAAVDAAPVSIPTGVDVGGEATPRAQVASLHRTSGASGSTLEVGSSSAGDGSMAERMLNGQRGSAARRSYAEERTVNEIVDCSMAALDGSRGDLDKKGKQN